jgi:hypothetical protein
LIRQTTAAFTAERFADVAATSAFVHDRCARGPRASADGNATAANAAIVTSIPNSLRATSTDTRA